MSDWSDGLMMRGGGSGFTPPSPPPSGGSGGAGPAGSGGVDWGSLFMGGGGGSPPTSGGGPSSSGFMDFLMKMVPGMTDGGYGFGGMNPNMIPLLATALNQYNNSGKYMDLATKYADEMNPFGKERPFYQDKLRALETDPNAYLKSSPDYQAALTQGLAAVDRAAASKGYAGSGTGSVDEMNYASQLAAQYLDRDRKSLMEMAGAGIGPAAAAGLISEGMRGSIDSQNQALANLFGAFTKPDPRTGGGGPGSGSGIPLDLGAVGNFVKNQDWQGLWKSSKTPVSDIFKYLKSLGMDASTALQQVVRMGLPTSDAFDRDSGGYLPGEPGYDSGGSTPWDFNPFPDNGSGNYGPPAPDTGGGWTSGYDLPVGGDGGGSSDWTSGYDLDNWTSWWMD